MAEMSVLCAYEAEQAVLGGLMLENERWDEVVLMLSPDDFYVAPHRAIFRAMSELAVNGQPLDLIT
ncbi:replicative DNA helicase, partial [Escherichia coli]